LLQRRRNAKFWFLVFAPLGLFYRKIESAFGAKPPPA
jgi:hypothetical protein